MDVLKSLKRSSTVMQGFEWLLSDGVDVWLENTWDTLHCAFRHVLALRKQNPLDKLAQNQRVYARYTNDARAHFNGVAISRARLEDEGEGIWERKTDLE